MSGIKLADRAAQIAPSPTLTLVAKAKALIAEGKNVIRFDAGEPDFPTPENICNAAIRAIQDGHHGYTPSPGIPEVREAVAAYYSRTRGIQVDQEDVVVGCGGKPFIGYSVLAVTDYGAGHEVIYPNPGFPIYKSLVQSHGAVPVELNLRALKALSARRSLGAQDLLNLVDILGERDPDERGKPHLSHRFLGGRDRVVHRGWMHPIRRQSGSPDDPRPDRQLFHRGPGVLHRQRVPDPIGSV